MDGSQAVVRAVAASSEFSLSQIGTAVRVRSQWRIVQPAKGPYFDFPRFSMNGIKGNWNPILSR